MPVFRVYALNTRKTKKTQVKPLSFLLTLNAPLEVFDLLEDLLISNTLGEVELTMKINKSNLSFKVSLPVSVVIGSRSTLDMIIFENLCDRVLSEKL